MKFHIVHTTSYNYSPPASESFMEARVCPANTPWQTVVRRSMTISPACRVSAYTDYYGNTVEQFSLIQRHPQLVLRAESEIETQPPAVASAALDITISEARQIYRSQPLRLFDFLNPSPGVQLGPRVFRAANKLFRPGDNLGEALLQLNNWIHERFGYAPGLTSVNTTVEEALALRKGVCQDFAHAMIAILRSAEIPARYVCGYIETESQRRAAERGERHLIGAAESHAWVEIGLPGGDWYALDPTNDIPTGERHVVVSVGRDFHDVSPTRGVFKGAGRTSLNVSVVMRRVESGADNN